MTKSELFKLLDKLEHEKGLRFDYGDSFEGAQYIRFEVDDDGDKLLSEATDEEIIAFADDEGYTLTVKDCQAIRERGVRDGETICEAVNALIEEEDEA